jgi:tetratricopeptide (TPR) repeat protein
MTGSPRLDRALLLHEQGRNELAEKELRAHLVDDPGDGFAHAVLALTLVDMERYDDAEAAAGQAIANEPQLAFAHHAMAVVLSERRRLVDAERAIREAIRLAPTSADSHAVLSSIEYGHRRWQAALDAAEKGLEFDPEHVGCSNLRAMALVNLGRASEAGTTIDRTLSRSPESALSHANMGWTLLEQGQRKLAMEHFRESLRLDPMNQWAKAGLVEAMKAGNPLYGVMLRYFMWMEKLSEKAGFAVIVGGYVGYQALRSVARTSPELAPFVLPLIVLYVVFCLLTWLARPLSNLTLLLHPVGRHALSGDQLGQGRLVGGTLALAVLATVAEIATPGDTHLLFVALTFGVLSLPLSAVHNCSPGWPRTTMAAIAGGLAIVGLTASVALGLAASTEGSVVEDAAIGAFVLFFLGIFLSQWIANWLVGRVPAR